MNVPFAKANLSSHVLQMCPYAWQNQYDMCLLLLSLEAIERICGQKRSEKSLRRESFAQQEKG